MIKRINALEKKPNPKNNQSVLYCKDVKYDTELILFISIETSGWR
jgi:hypothetical protein